MKCPVSLGEKFENSGFSGFSKTHTIFFGRVLVVCGERLNVPAAYARQRFQADCSVSAAFTLSGYFPAQVGKVGLI